MNDFTDFSVDDAVNNPSSGDRPKPSDNQTGQSQPANQVNSNRPNPAVDDPLATQPAFKTQPQAKFQPPESPLDDSNVRNSLPVGPWARPDQPAVSQPNLRQSATPPNNQPLPTQSSPLPQPDQPNPNQINQPPPTTSGRNPDQTMLKVGLQAGYGQNMIDKSFGANVRNQSNSNQPSLSVNQAQPVDFSQNTTTANPQPNPPSQPTDITRQSEPPGRPESFTKAVRGETASSTKPINSFEIETPQHKKNLEILGESNTGKLAHRLRHPYSHSEQLKKKRQVSSFIIHILALALFSGIITSSYIMWPRIGALIEKFRLDENKLMVKLLDELFQQPSQQYDIIINGRQWQADKGLKDTVGFQDGSEESHFHIEGILKVDQSNTSAIRGQSGSGKKSMKVEIHREPQDAIVLNYETLQQKDNQFVKLKTSQDDKSTWMTYTTADQKANSNFDKLLKNLLVTYNYWNYSLVMPSIRIEKEDVRQATVLLTKEAYTLSDCDPSLREQTSYTTCNLKVNYDLLYSAYEFLYKHYFDDQIPEYYSIMDSKSSAYRDVWLPTNFRIKINRLTNLPVMLESQPSTNRGNSVDQTTIRVDYQLPSKKLEIDAITGLLKDEDKKALINKFDKNFFGKSKSN